MEPSNCECKAITRGYRGYTEEDSTRCPQFTKRVPSSSPRRNWFTQGHSWILFCCFIYGVWNWVFFYLDLESFLIHWILDSVLTTNPKVHSWGNDFRHTEPCYGFSVNLLSPTTLRHLASEKPFWIWTSLQHSKGRVGRTCASLYPCPYLSGLRKKDCFSTLTFGHDILPTQWPWISCEGTSPSSCWKSLDTN